MDDDHLDHTIPNHHPTKMDVLPKLFAAKWHTRHLSTTPKQHSNNLCILFCINPSYRTIDKSNMLSNQSPLFAGPPTIQGSMVIMDYEHVISEIDLLFSLGLLKYLKKIFFTSSIHGTICRNSDRPVGEPQQKDLYRRERKGRHCCLRDKFLAVLAILYQNDLKNRIKSSQNRTT